MPNSLLNTATLTTLLTQHPDAPVVSIYANIDPADRPHTRLRVQDLIRQAKQHVTRQFGTDWWASIEPRVTAALSDDALFAQNIKESIAVLTTADQVIIDHLSTNVTDQVSVSTVPELRPLLREQQRAFDFDLLALNGDSFKLYQIRNHRVILTPLPEDAPTTLTQALGTEIRGGDVNGVSRGEHAGYHGHHTKDVGKDIDLTNYFQAVDNFMQAWQKDTQRPLILFALPENQALFRKLSRLAHVSTKYVLNESPANLSTAQIQQRIEPLFEQHADQIIQTGLKTYHDAANANHQVKLPTDIATAVSHGQLGTLIVADTSEWNGHLDRDQFIADPTAANAIPSLCVTMLQHGGDVIVVNEDQLPDGQPVGISRY
ncbi:baeRF6 domain-containing protein [Furfurilactobacillus rossiae]|uniref:Bacterial archaeo-eukaryotic release factor family 6 domain-containing protein n=1 Tax=Furfurilactobacillus rossiae DSM 15814 TaxID=1114972 RepID=A0A0R1R9H7_9LACO|nr:hypothetical protein [Furfurilactobacillus rossiae]KRL53372.1 hypothetical protein FD35_GL001308 [Furfurilactobacillus rossiae DSM 15814]QFR67153.1 hypothetical protein LR814_08595 [Furfurilactobacillus rossiae]QLE60074.1 hypothetical protein LROSRS0_0026 [Furfurilactobacillus rossiae]